MKDSDWLELHELPGRYGDIVDDHDWDGLGRIFLPQATFEVNGRVFKGLDEISRWMSSEAAHPRTHLLTNVHIELTDEGVVLHSRLVTMREDGTINSGRYRDIVVKGDNGWRVSRRVFQTTPRERPVAPTVG